MKFERGRWLIPALLAIVLLLSCHNAFAQLRITGTLSGSVHDPTGAVVPGAKVVLKDEGTGISKETTATAMGTFLFPDLAHGSYEITVSTAGFQQTVVTHIELSASQTVDVPVQLKVGQVSESVEVEGGSIVALETTSNLNNSTTTTKLVNELPLSGRQALDLAILVPGATGGQRINNVAGGAISVSVDGINDASNGWKSGGTVWYTTVPIRLGALEEVTVESGGLGADSGAESGVNVKFITKRGTNQYHGSVFYQPYSEQFNANGFSNNAQNTPRTKSRRHEFGGNIGGRMVPFGFLKDKLFFFLNWEDVWSPSDSTTTTGIITPEAQAGYYRYLINGTTNQYNTVNVMTLAQQYGYSTTVDPIVKSFMDIANKIPALGVQQQNSDLGRELLPLELEAQRQTPTTPPSVWITTSRRSISFPWRGTIAIAGIPARSVSRWPTAS